ncbi:hypothetical protein ACK31J_18715 [Aeromonas caviae]
MSTAINCAKGNEMPEIWVVIITVILIMIIYAYIASKIKDRKRKKAREKSLPFVEDNVHPGVQSDIPHLIAYSGEVEQPFRPT